jgi:hypothetical protein
MKRLILPMFVVLVFGLVACAPAQAAQPQAFSTSTLVPTKQLPPVSSATQDTTVEMVRSDEQGAVIFQITPLNLNTSSDPLEFDVAMNTHSIDLSMDLATLSTLTTDTGVTIQATKWDAPRGGHHVNGKLIFPAAQNGKSILEGASKLTLTIVKVDAASRVFEWELK